MDMTERPRSVGPARAAALLYGDWGTSKAYVLGIAFGLAGYSSFPILAAMAALTALVGLNYYWVCSLYPDGGGVYSAVRDRSKMIASVGALLLIADYLVTASLSVLEGFHYIFHLMEGIAEVQGWHMPPLPSAGICAIALLMLLGVINWWGPRHSGALAVFLAVPASLAAISVGLIALPYLGEAHLEPSTMTFGQEWMLFAGIVLALSGVEAVSNMTGVMVADKKKGPDGQDTVKRTSAIAIGIVAAEVVGLTILLAYAMHAIPNLDRNNIEAMMGQMAQHFGAKTFGAGMGAVYAAVVGVVMALLLFSAGNTAIIGMISVYYMMSKDREMPPAFGKLNKHGVPTLPLLLATALPIILLIFVHETKGLAALYAIGVVGAITVNLGACATNKKLKISIPVRAAMGGTALLMLAIWVTIGYEKHEALIFAASILMFGLFARSFVQERRLVREEAQFQQLLGEGRLSPDTPNPDGGPRLLVALRGVTDTLGFALEETRQRGGRLAALYVREVKTMIPVKADVYDDPQALAIFKAVQELAGDTPIDMIYRVSNDVPDCILRSIVDYKADYIVMGAPAGKAILNFFRGSFAAEIAQNLPAGVRLLIFSWRPAAGEKVGVDPVKVKKVA